MQLKRVSLLIKRVSTNFSYTFTRPRTIFIKFCQKIKSNILNGIPACTINIINLILIYFWKVRESNWKNNNIVCHKILRTSSILTVIAKFIEVPGT